MNSIVLVSEQKVPKGLVSKTTFKVLPSKELKMQILQDLATNYPQFSPENFLMEIDINVVFSKYEIQQQEKKHWYDT